MSTLSSFQETSKAAALEVIKKGPETAKSLKESFDEHFPPSQSLSAVRAKYDAMDVSTTANEPLAKAINTTVDAVDAVLADMACLTQYVTLTIPKMEDGGNWGVSVQLAAVKAMSDSKEKIDKGLDEIVKYYASRADAMEKCKQFSTQAKVNTTTKTQATSEGNDSEKGDNKSNETKTVVEEKETVTTQGARLELEYRKNAVTAIDVLYYTKAKSLFQLALTSYMASVDFADKNADKLASPKGSNGSGSTYSSMY